MKVVVGFVDSAEGRAALDRALDECRLRGGELIMVHNLKPSASDEETLKYRELLEKAEQEILRDSGVPYTVRKICLGRTPAEELVRVAKEEEAELIVIGLRRRSPVGKILLGSTAQDVLLNAECAVLAVKAKS